MCGNFPTKIVILKESNQRLVKALIRPSSVVRWWSEDENTRTFINILRQLDNRTEVSNQSDRRFHI